jgi:polyhydroxyalkanoate synthesis regulator phasin
MIHIKSFFNRMSIMESKQSISLVMTKDDARGLRDEISSLLADLHKLKNEEIIEVKIKGGTFK